MENLITKLSTYNILNYLLSGVVFAILATEFTAYNFIQDDIVIGVFLYYTLGLIISRIGSLVFEPFLKLIKFVQFGNYSDFTKAEKKDEKIKTILREANVYRTFLSLFSLLLLLQIYEKLEYYYSNLIMYRSLLITLALIFLFLSAYRKQNNYITKRVKEALKP